MNLNVKRQIAVLRKMPAAMLREKHQQVFDEPTRSGHREHDAPEVPSAIVVLTT